MTGNDNLHRFMFENASVRGEYIHLDTSFQTIVTQHQYPAPIQKLLGEALCVAGLVAAIIKFKGRLSVQFQGKGKLKMLLAQCDNNFHVRGLVKWDDQSDAELTYEDLMESFNDGVLSIMISASNSTKSYQGMVGWRGNSLVSSIEGYFKDSEQLATRLWLSVDNHSAAGLLLQTMPGTESVHHDMEQEALELHWKRLIAATEPMLKTDLLHLSCDSLLRKLYSHDDVRIFEPQIVAFRCTCSRQRGEEAIAVLGKKEAEEEVQQKQVLVVTCDFCNKEYSYDKVDVAAIFANRGSSSHADLH